MQQDGKADAVQAIDNCLRQRRAQDEHWGFGLKVIRSTQFT